MAGFPKYWWSFFRYIEAEKIPAIIVVVYGNREYKDALLELTNESKNHGFIPLAAGAFIGEHSFSQKVGTGRPNEVDMKEAGILGEHVARQLENELNLAEVQLEVSGNFPYAPGMDMPMAPSTDKVKCVGCMMCQKNCPVQAINPLDVLEVDGWRCLDCGKCVRECKMGAKAFTYPPFVEKIAVLEAMFQQPRQSEFFYSDK